MGISQQQFDDLLEQIRELTARVYRLEEIAAAGKSKSEPEQPHTRPAVPIPSAQVELPAPPQVATLPPPPKVSAQYARNISPSAPSSASAKASSADLESRIGSHWLNRIGIAAVLVGVSFFLDYAFENNWIGPAGRIVIGLIAGIAVVLWSEYFRKRAYDIFSYSLKALGIGVLYLSLWASFQVYHLLPSAVVFAGMVVVTASMCAMAFAQDA